MVLPYSSKLHISPLSFKTLGRPLGGLVPDLDLKTFVSLPVKHPETLASYSSALRAPRRLTKVLNESRGMDKFVGIW